MTHVMVPDDIHASERYDGATVAKISIKVKVNVKIWTLAIAPLT